MDASLPNLYYFYLLKKLCESFMWDLKRVQNYDSFTKVELMLILKFLTQFSLYFPILSGCGKWPSDRPIKIAITRRYSPEYYEEKF